MPRIKVLHVLEAMGGGTTKLLDGLITHLDPAEFEISLALPPPMSYDPLRPLADPAFPERMREKGLRRMPVVNDIGTLQGILTMDDILELLAEELMDVVAMAVRQRQKEKQQRP